MYYIEIATGTRVSIYAIRALHPNMSIPDGADLGGLGYARIFDAPQPALQPGEYTTAGPVVEVGAEWAQTWIVHAAPSPAVLIAEKQDALWSAADSYTRSHISGVAVGILTIGVLQRLPKCSAVAGWSGAVWAEYYRRKPLVTADSADDHDFSAFGPMPYSVPEMQAEVGM